MIIEVEDRFCKVANAFSKVLEKLEGAAERGDVVHEVEETTWFRHFFFDHWQTISFWQWWRRAGLLDRDTSAKKY